MANPAPNGGNKSRDEHLHEQVIENITFLVDTGLSFELACRRIGKSEDTVVQAFRRRRLPCPGKKSQMEDA